MFNTGLYTNFYQEIFAYFTKNQNADKQKWFLDGFYTSYPHIFNDPDNFLRIPESIRESSNKIMLFDGAIKRAKQMINANYKTAVPQYYKGKIQLLIPICLINDNVPDLALVVSKNEMGNQYLGHTCLTLDMAYNNARLIARPDSNWLKP